MDRLDLTADPEETVAAVAENVRRQPPGGSHDGGHDAVSVRTAVHDGHEIVIRTTYEILVDGEPFDPHIVIDNGGRVHYHGLPTRDFASLVDLVAKAIDAFPDDFAHGAYEPGDDPGGHDGDDHDGHDDDGVDGGGSGHDGDDHDGHDHDGVDGGDDHGGHHHAVGQG